MPFRSPKGAKELRNYLVYALGFKHCVIGAMWGNSWFIVDTLGQLYHGKNSYFKVIGIMDIP